MKSEYNKNPNYPRPTTSEVIQEMKRIHAVLPAYDDAIAKAKQTLDDIEQNRFEQEPDPADQVDQWLLLGNTHETLTNRTIPVLTKWRDSWTKELEQRKERITNWIESGVLPQRELPRVATIFEALTSSQETEEQPDAEEPETLDDEFTHFQYGIDTRMGEKTRSIDIQNALDPEERAVLRTLTKNNRTGSWLKSRDINKELRGLFGQQTVQLSLVIESLREFLGDDLDDPKIIDQKGQKSGTWYRFNAKEAAFTTRSSQKPHSTPEKVEDLSERKIGGPIFSSEQAPTYYSPQPKIMEADPEIKNTLITYITDIADRIGPNDRWNGRMIVNQFRGFAGTFTETFEQKAQEKGIIKRDIVHGRRNAHPSFNREDVLMMRYYHEHEEILARPGVTVNQLRRIVREVVHDYEQREREN